MIGDIHGRDARATSRKKTCWLCLEGLESRLLLSAVAPTAFEQYMVELINRARANPPTEAESYGIDSNEGIAANTISTDPKPPVASNEKLVVAAHTYSQWVLDNDTFSHTGEDDIDPKQRTIDAGFEFRSSQKSVGNISLLGSASPVTDLTSEIEQMHETLFVDDTTRNRTHRPTILDEQLTQIGVGLASGDYYDFDPVAATQDFAQSGTDLFLTGVVYDGSLSVGTGDDSIRLAKDWTKSRSLRWAVGSRR